jgi:phage terminase small subunit
MMLKEPHREFARLYLSGLSATEAYLKAFDCSEVTASRKGSLLLERESVKQYIKELQDKIDVEVFSSVKEAIVERNINAVLDAVDKRILLGEIIRAEKDIDDVVLIKGVPVPFKRKPRLDERLKALELDNKMAGDNATVKQETVLKSDAGISITFEAKEDEGFNENESV